VVRQFDFVVIGAGFFGTRLALLLARDGSRVALVERGATVCGQASYANQARVHNGYHYPRSYSTALGSHKNYDRFRSEMIDCTIDDFDHVYAIARNSYTNAYQFQQFCRALGLPLRRPQPRHLRLFSRQRIEDVFLVREAAFDALRLRSMLEERVRRSPTIECMMNTTCDRVDLGGDGAIVATTAGSISAPAVFIAAYAGTNSLLARSEIPPLDLKVEIAEIGLVEMPAELSRFAVTVMDGPFFSCMPMPAEQCHSLTHVKYTPQVNWKMGAQPESVYRVIESMPKVSRFVYMLKDAQRYIPAFAGLRYKKSLFEAKAIPNRHEMDDGRPILMRVHNTRPLCVSILGSKLDSVFELEDAIPTLSQWFA
jgi:glycine/D-amino acid oxidase-like deaminating enzyme